MSVREMPLERLLSKAFYRPWETPEAEAARMVLAGRSDLRDTRFGHLRLGVVTWETPGHGEQPRGLDTPLRYWETPWMSKLRRPISLKERVARRLRFRKTVSDFRTLVRIMDWKGWVGQPVPGILLVDHGPRTTDHKERECFLFTDGNRRIGAAAAVGILNVPVKVSPLLTFDWKATKAAGRGRFTDADTRRIWEHAWKRIEPRAESRDTC